MSPSNVASRRRRALLWALLGDAQAAPPPLLPGPFAGCRRRLARRLLAGCWPPAASCLPTGLRWLLAAAGECNPRLLRPPLLPECPRSLLILPAAISAPAETALPFFFPLSHLSAPELEAQCRVQRRCTLRHPPRRIDPIRCRPGRAKRDELSCAAQALRCDTTHLGCLALAVALRLSIVTFTRQNTPRPLPLAVFGCCYHLLPGAWPAGFGC